MKKFTFLFFFFIILHQVIAQNNSAILIPRTVYVGDPAVLIFSLPGAEQNINDIVLTPLSPDFPSHENIDFHKIILERRTGVSRLIIEFTAFVPGFLELPVIEIGEDRFSGFSVTINSITEGRSPLILSGPASSLAMPGTGLMLYGTLSLLIVLVIFTFWIMYKGHKYLIRWRNRYKRWLLFISIKLTERQIYKSVLKGADKRKILNKLSDQLRIFLSFLTGNNCRSMTANEFENQDFNPLLLGKFFRRCDELRFSGADINNKDIMDLLADVRGFLKTIEKTAIVNERAIA